MGTQFSCATLDDWKDVRALWEAFRNSRHGSRIEVSDAELRDYFSASLVNENAGVLLGRQDGELRGLLVVKAVLQADSRQGMRLVPATFIAGVYVTPHAGLAFSDAFFCFLDGWSHARRHLLQIGNARPPQEGVNNYKLRAVERRYGFKLSHMVVERQLEVAPSG